MQDTRKYNFHLSFPYFRYSYNQALICNFDHQINLMLTFELFLESLLALLKERLNLEPPKNHPSVNRDLDENVVPEKDEDEEKVEKMKEELLTRLNPNLDENQTPTPQPSNPILEDVDPIGNPVNPAGSIYHNKYKLQQLSPVHPTSATHVTSPVHPTADGLPIESVQPTAPAHITTHLQQPVQPTSQIHPTESVFNQNNRADHKLHLTNPILEMLTGLNSDSQQGNLIQLLKENPLVLGNEDSSKQQIQQTLKQLQLVPSQQQQQHLLQTNNLKLPGMDKSLTSINEELKQKLRLALGMNPGASQQQIGLEISHGLGLGGKLGLASGQKVGLGTSQGLGLGGTKFGLATGQQLGVGAGHHLGLAAKLGLASGQQLGLGTSQQLGIGVTGQLGIGTGQHLDPEKIKQLGLDQSEETNPELITGQNQLGAQQLGTNNQLTEAIRIRLGLEPQELKLQKLQKLQQVNPMENKDSSSQNILNRLLLTQSASTQQQTLQKQDQALSAESANLPCNSETNSPCPEQQTGLQSILSKLGIQKPDMNEPCNNRLSAGLQTSAPCNNNNIETKINELLKEKESPASILPTSPASMLPTTPEPPNQPALPPAIPSAADKCKQQQFGINPEDRPNPVHPVSPLLDPDNPCRLAERPSGPGLDLMQVMELKARAAESGEGMNCS